MAPSDTFYHFSFQCLWNIGIVKILLVSSWYVSGNRIYSPDSIPLSIANVDTYRRAQFSKDNDREQDLL